MDEKDEKRLQNIREKIATMKKQEQTVVARIKEKERKSRTRRLIQNGAVAEKYLNCEGFEPTEFEERIKEIAKLLQAIDGENGTARNDGKLQRNDGIPN
ncbi:MAG: hypothetical protein FWE06_07580 [Oscillospiraceae bacterium]|nr:hypothetical protein [Oscillospiraceae bacterium]